MRGLQAFPLLASLSNVLAVPYIVGEAQLHVAEPFLAPRELASPSIKSTSVGMGPPSPTGPPVSKTTTTTTTRVTTTTTRVTTTTTTARGGATQTIDVTGMTYINAMLLAHNVHRPNHTEANLAWNASLASTAQKIGQTCDYQHNITADGGGYGQNIGAGAAGNAAAGLINNLMYNGEINNYPQPYGVDNADTSNFGSWGHYSQLVWSDTTSVGCATVYCPQGLKNTGPGIAPYFTVCNYYPPGNYVGQFSKVKAPQGGNSVVIIGS